MKTLNLKFCKDCKYFRLHTLEPKAKCVHPSSLLEYNLVYGNAVYSTCESMRAQECGKEAKLFQ